jgi:hypothetical protein
LNQRPSGYECELFVLCTFIEFNIYSTFEHFISFIKLDKTTQNYTRLHKYYTKILEEKGEKYAKKTRTKIHS